MAGAQHFLQRVLTSGLPLPRARKRHRVISALSRILISGFSHLSLAAGVPIPQPVIRVDNPGDRFAPAAAAAPRRRGPGWSAKQVQDILDAREALDTRNDLIILENMSRGSMADLIQKLVDSGARLSNRTLWLIFECLFKACVAMSTPYLCAQEGKNPRTEQMPLQDETVPQIYYDQPDVIPSRPMVHFDIDPNNSKLGR